MLQSLQCGHFSGTRPVGRVVPLTATPLTEEQVGRHRCLALRPQGRRGDPARAEGASRCTGTARAAGSSPRNTGWWFGTVNNGEY